MKPKTFGKFYVFQWGGKPMIRMNQNCVYMTVVESMIVQDDLRNAILYATESVHGSRPKAELIKLARKEVGSERI